MPGPAAATLGRRGESMWEPNIRLRVAEQRGSLGSKILWSCRCTMPKGPPNAGDVQYTLISLLHLLPVWVLFPAAQILPC